MRVQMTLSMERMARLFLGLLTGRGANHPRIPRLDLMTLNARDLADLNLPAEARSRFMGLSEALEWRRRV